MNDDLNSGLNGNMRDFFADDGSDAKTPLLGGVGAFILHTVVIALLIYSGYHGIHASARYRESQGLGNAAGIVGILIIELVMLGIYLAYFYRRITGDGQKYAAGATFGVGVVLISMGIVGDSLLQAGIALPSWLATYLTLGLPVAPVIMSIGAAVVMATEPKLIRQIKATLKREDAAEKRHAARMKAEDAKLMVAQSAANLQLNSLQMTAEYAHAAYRAPEVQQAIQAAALANLPELLRGAGIMLPYGTVIEGQVVEPLPTPPAPTPAPAEAQSTAPRSSWRERVFGRAEQPVAVVVNSTHDTPAAELRPDALGQGQRTYTAAEVDVMLHEAMTLAARNATARAADAENGANPTPRPDGRA